MFFIENVCIDLLQYGDLSHIQNTHDCVVNHAFIIFSVFKLQYNICVLIEGF